MNRSSPLLPLLVLVASGCELLESATDVSFGEGQVSRVSETVNWPNPDELIQLTDDDDGLPGFPSTLQKATMAHLAGALEAKGLCHTEVPFEKSEGGQGMLQGGRTRITVCDGDARCAARCPDPAEFTGLLIDVEVDMVLLGEEAMEELESRIANVSPRDIIQVRLRFFEIELFQMMDGERVEVTSMYEDFRLGIGHEGVETVWILDAKDIENISPDAPRRYEIDPHTDFTRRLKVALLTGQLRTVRMVKSARIDSSNLFDLRVGDAGLFIDMQPELVINVLDAAAAEL